MEIIKACSLCGSTGQKVLFTGGDLLHGAPGTFRLVECSACGQIYLTPRPEAHELDRYYPSDYISYPIAIDDEPSAYRRWDRAYGVHKRCREVIRRAGGPGRLLDVGCATGIFLHAMQRRGWEACGVEPSAYAAQYARSRLNLDVVQGFLEDAAFPGENFDLVTMWDVLEHVPDPGATLAEVSRVLKPGGWLVLSLPNPESWERALFGRCWAGWDVPRHFHLFTRRVLARQLERAGLRLEEVTSFTGRHGVLVLNVQFWMRERNVAPQTQKLVTGLLRSLPARLLTWPAYNLLDRLNKSSIMVVFARKG